ncbi:unnamed protein product [Paramecium primaurelia]|uniref:Uncharacterized protein n=1 Tax=Paramecium primaurelia TaxID=5886 RepID=A0A8S1P049_PARPR|nr:unnamed protein product [Paramecium primaurelia]
MGKKLKVGLSQMKMFRNKQNFLWLEIKQMKSSLSIWVLINNKSQSFYKQLKYAQKLIKARQTNTSYEYNEFLTNCQYHDLRYCKQQELHRSGLEEKLIQNFVMHANFKTTQVYIQENQQNDVIDFHLTETILNDQEVYKSAELILNFKDDNDYN